MMNRPAFVLGQFLGVTSMVEQGLTTPAQFIDSCIRIAKEYEASKADPEPYYKVQAKQIATAYNTLAEREAEGDPHAKL
jgi:hypothetical protein